LIDMNVLIAFSLGERLRGREYSISRRRSQRRSTAARLR